MTFLARRSGNPWAVCALPYPVRLCALSCRVWSRLMAGTRR